MDMMKEKLDRVLVNVDWLNLFPGVGVKVSSKLSSDHLPLIICKAENSVHAGVSNRRKVYRFEHMWTRSDDCGKIIQEQWEKTAPAMGLDGIRKKCEVVGCALKRWSWSSFGHLQRRIRELREKLADIQAFTTTSDKQEVEDSLTYELEELLEREELLWRQRSKMEWMILGDRNTKFFHTHATQRRKTNTILGLEDDAGNWVKKHHQIEEVAVSYFKKIFQTSNPHIHSWWGSVIQRKVSPEMNEWIGRRFEEKEILFALKNMSPTKSPGLDRKPTIFFKKYWPTVGKEMMRWVLEVLNEGKSMDVVNDTFIALIS
ncbi:hypothetical protein U1Q18_052591 [Sarracenia purpurea var. burkii]